MLWTRRFLMGLCVTCLPQASGWAAPQSDNFKITAVVRVGDDAGEAGQESADGKSGTAQGKDPAEGRKERKALRLQFNKGPIVLMAAQQSDESNQEKKADAGKSEVLKVWLGIGLKEVEGDLATYLGSSNGVFIERVFPESPAAVAKLKEGDVVVAFQGEKVAGRAELVEALRSLAPLESTDKEDAKSTTYPNIVLTVLRRGQELKVELTPQERPEHLKIARSDEAEGTLDGAKIFKFGQPGDAKLRFQPFGKMKSNVVIVVKEDGKEYIARVERDGDAAPKITVTNDKQEQELSEDQLDQLPEKVRDAIRKALKGDHSFEFREGADLNQEVLNEVQQQIEKAMKQVGGGKLRIERLTDEDDVIILDPAKLFDPAQLQEWQRLSEDAKGAAKKWVEAGAATIRDFTAVPAQMQELKAQVEDLRKQIEELKAQMKSKKE